MPVSISGSGSITGVSSLTQLTKLGVTGILTATDFSGPSGGAADFPNGLTATTASFSGNLSVGGVLTYDDVTNIDSVGVVTARDGLHVTGGKVSVGSNNPSGNLNISYLQVGKGQVSSDHSLYNYNTSFTNNAYQNGNGTFAHITSRAVGVINLQDNVLTFSNGPGGTVGQSATLTERLRITSAGLIGIGTHTPAANIDVQKSGTGTIARFGVGDGTTNLDIKYSSNTTTFDQQNNKSIAFETADTERLRITSDGKVRVPDNGKLTLGAGDDLQIWSDNTDQYIRGEQNQLILRSNNLKLQSYLGENYINCAMNYDVSLYYDNSKKFETTATGVEVSGATKTDTLEVTQEYPSIRPTLDLNFAATKVLDDRITFTRDGVGTYIDENGVLKYASNNTPRFDHDPMTGESLGLLIEESRTNILGLSSDLTDNNGNDWDNINGTISVNQTTAPDGTTTAASFTAAAGNAEHSVVFAELVPTGNVTASVWIKPNTYSIVSFVLYGEANSTVSYNLSTKTVYNQGSNVSRATITEYPNGWYRISATMNCTVSNSRVYRLFASTGNFNAGGSESFYYWGPQVESGSFETSYIPTNASNTSVTRGVDTAIIKGTNFSSWYNVSESTIFFESGVAPVTNSKYFTFHGVDGGGVELIEAAAVSGPGANIFTYANSTVWSNISVTDASATTLKYATGIKANDINLAVNGTLGTTDTSSQQPDALDKLIIGNYSSGNYYINTTIKKLSYYNKRLPNAQLQGLTQQ